MPFVVVMEPWEAFINRVMRQPNVWKRLSLKVIPLEIELDLQWRVHEIIKMSLSSWRHGNLYKSEEILHVQEKLE
jgi:hypothetical protein